jgi:hypothetical protein
MSGILSAILSRLAPARGEEGAVAIGWLLLGIVIGVVLVVFAIIKFLIPGE